MNTKRDYAIQLMDLLYPSTTIDSKLELQIAEVAISQACDEIRVQEIYRLKALGSNIVPSSYLNTFTDLTPKYDENRCEWYIDLPAKPLALPNNQGLQQVFYLKNKSQTIRVVSPLFLSSFKNSLALGLEGDHACYQDQFRLYFVNDLDEGTQIGMRMVASSVDLGSFDYFPIDESISSRVLERAAQTYGIQKNIQQDLTDNNVSE